MRPPSTQPPEDDSYDVAQAGVRVKTEAERAAEAKAKKDAVSREEAELRMLFSQMATGAAKKSKAEEAAREVRAHRSTRAISQAGHSRGGHIYHWVRLSVALR